MEIGGFSIFHWIFLLVILGILVGSVLLIVWAVNRSNAKPGNPGVTPPPIEHSTEARLRDLDALRARGVVTEAEYAERRAAILQSL